MHIKEDQIIEISGALLYAVPYNHIMGLAHETANITIIECSGKEKGVTNQGTSERNLDVGIFTVAKMKFR